MIDLIAILASSPDPIPVPIPIQDANVTVIVAAIGAVASIMTAGITAFFAYLMVKVKRVAEATHTIVNHDRQVMLEGQAQTLRIAAMDHPGDQSLRDAWMRAEEAVEHARKANELAESKLRE